MSNESYFYELPEIRRKIYEKTKNMTSAEATAYFNTRGEAAAKKYGFKVVHSASKKCDTLLMPPDAEVLENAKI
jgi:hypothetical protein